MSLTSRVLHQRLRRATAEEAESLALAPRRRVFELERVRIVDGDPLSLDRSCLPGTPGGCALRRRVRVASLYDVLAERCGLVPGARECTLRAAVADARTAGELGIPAGAPLLVVQEAVLDQHGDPLEFAVLANRGDRWRYRTTQMTREVESRAGGPPA